MIMARNKTLVPVVPDTVIDGINVVFIGTLEEALFGPRWFEVSYEVRSAVTVAWMRRNGAHYYAEEKVTYNDEWAVVGVFSVHEGVRQAKRFGFRTVVCENLS